MQEPLSGEDFAGATIVSEVNPSVTYRLERQLGEGATALAYFATRTLGADQSPVVMKIILPEVVAQAGETALMVVRKEAVALGRLNERVPPTPFVVRFMDAGAVPYAHSTGTTVLPWLAVEYVHGGVEGTTLQERVQFTVKQTGYAFDRDRATRCVSHVCQGLSEVHHVGVIHRDLTPNNVLCCGFADEEMFKISDFGVARPCGMEGTFGAAALGTPGYMAPEQGLDRAGECGPPADIFALAGIVYFILTGEPYFDGTNAVTALIQAGSDRRRRLVDGRGLCPELRNDPEACNAIDQVLARASAANPSLRPSGAKGLAAMLLPLLADTLSPRASERYVASVMRARVSPDIPGWDWTVRHPPGDDRVVRSVGWDGDGHCLAATTLGLEYWDGTEWVAVPRIESPVPSVYHFVRRIQPGRWLIGCDRATLVDYSRAGVHRVVQGPDQSMSFVNAGGDLAGLTVVVAETRGRPPELCARMGEYWVRPFPVSNATALMGLGKLDDTHWLVAGRSVDGAALAAVFNPLEWHLHPLNTPPARALVACASRPERGVAAAVGGQGAMLRVQHGQPLMVTLSGEPNLASVSMDLLDRTWAGGAGEVWVSPAGGQGWSRVWHDPQWQAPFVSIFANVGLVVAMTADGAVLECRAPVTALSRGSVPPAQGPLR